MLRRRQADGTVINPLQVMIERMKKEASRERGSLASCYELSIAAGEYDFPIYNTVDDKGYRIGGPCLSHLSFKLWNGAVHLTAVYRSHCYRWKVLGNLLGLARLQQFVADQVEVGVGSLIIHSTYAYLDGSKRSVVALLNEIEELEGK
jgi:thymidylate synthase